MNLIGSFRCSLTTEHTALMVYMNIYEIQLIHMYIMCNIWSNIV